jgi:hypothetical protein
MDVEEPAGCAEVEMIERFARKIGARVEWVPSPGVPGVSR